MSIRKLGEKKWVIDYYPEGRKGKRVMTVFRGTESDARRFEAEMRKSTPGTMPINPKIIDVIPEYLAWAELHLAPKTVEDIKKSLKWIQPHFGHLQVPRVTHTIIDQYKILRKGKNCAINKELSYFSGIIRFMVDRDYARPLAIKMTKVPYKRPAPVAPHHEDIERFIAEVRDPIKRSLVLMMYLAGLRYGDVVKICWPDIDFAQRTVTLVQKGGEHRLTILPDAVHDLLYPMRKPKGFVFENPQTGKPYGSLKTLFKLAAKRAEIKHFSPHKLRHAAATEMLTATGDIFMVKQMLGHKDIKTTQIYLSTALEHLREGMKRTANYTSNLKKLKHPDND